MDASTWLLVAPMVGLAISLPLAFARASRNYVYRNKWWFLAFILSFGGLGIYLAWTGFTFDALSLHRKVQYMLAVIGAWLGLAVVLNTFRLSREKLSSTILQIRPRASGHPRAMILMLVGLAIMILSMDLDDIGILSYDGGYDIVVWFIVLLTGLAICGAGVLWYEYEKYLKREMGKI